MSRSKRPLERDHDHAKKAERMGRSQKTEYYLKFPRLKSQYDCRDELMRWQIYLALWLWCFYGDSVRCFVMRKREISQFRYNYLNSNWLRGLGE